MKSKASTDKTVISVDLNIKTIQWAEKLGLDLSEIVNQLLKVDVKKRLKEIKFSQTRTKIPV